MLLGVTDPWLLAGLLYLGSGVSLSALRVARAAGLGAARAEAPITRESWPWLAAAIGSGGIAGPVLLMFGLARSSAAETSLLLNLEGVLTAALAWGLFREHLNRRVVAGMAAITVGALTLAGDPFSGFRWTWASVLVAGACLAWAVDNNLTRKVSAGDPVQITALKGLIAGAVNIVLALALGRTLPGPSALAGAAVVGAVSYGLSLVLFILALRRLGAGRASAYFSTAPFVGALGGVIALGEPVTRGLLVASAFMAVGVWLHVTEDHGHEHPHDRAEHDHRHSHDEHHQHEHGPGALPGEPHSHPHVHGHLWHGHPHYPDIHHRHRH
jgi:drug/metabolite transporter (DMT)-like permease